jgi:acetyl esterase/lipase
MHGGGYVIGSAAQDDALCQAFVEKTGATVVSVDYRLAPESPFPGPLDDCHAGLTWLAAQPGVDSTKIAIGGASAGGGLAAALAIRVRDSGPIQPVLQLLAYPMIDDRSVTVDTRHRLWDAKSNRFGWQSYLGEANPAVVAPARHPDLAGLAPAWIGVGTLDLFFDEDKAYAERLEQSGVACEFLSVPGAFHGFDLIVKWAGVTKSFFTAQCEALRAAFAG